MLFFSIIVKIFSRRFLMAIIGNSPAMQRLRKQIEKIAKTNAAILLQGESGTGKELVAMAIHKLSERSSKEFVAINCGAIPESLMESLLFGYEEGAFSGAKKNGQQGLLETANGGTLFLDEAGEMPYLMQAKILRTLQTTKSADWEQANRYSLTSALFQQATKISESRWNWAIFAKTCSTALTLSPSSSPRFVKEWRTCRCLLIFSSKTLKISIIPNFPSPMDC